MNLIFYGRYSDSGQSEQSIEGQRKICYDFAERNGYKIIGEYIDRATTGTSDNRPEFQRMINDSAKRQFQGVLVYQLDSLCVISIVFIKRRFYAVVAGKVS